MKDAHRGKGIFKPVAEYQTRPSFLQNGSSGSNVPVGGKKKLMFTDSGDRNTVWSAGTGFEISIDLLVLLTGSVICHVLSAY